MSPIRIRDAQPGEARCLSGLAYRSKAHWGYSREFMQSCEAELTYQEDQIDDNRFHFAVAQLDLEITGFYAIKALSARQFELEALFVEPEYIGQGVGCALIQHALDIVAAKHGESLFIQGDPNAERFYLAAGAEQIGTQESGSIPGRFLPAFEIAIKSSVDDT